MVNFILVVEVAALAPLQAAMGPAVTDRAVGELLGRLPTTLAGVLARLPQLQILADVRPGRWCAGFFHDGADTAETIEAARMATQRLLFDLTSEVFGAATGQWAHVVAEILPCSGLTRSDPPGALDAWLDQHLGQRSTQAAEISRLHAAVSGLIADRALRTFLQPIVAFPSGTVLGYEALSRGPVGHPLERADALFAAASRSGLSQALEWACAEQALRWRPRLPDHLWMTVNTSLPLLQEPEMLMMLARPGVVVEITEHLPLDQAPEVLPLLHRLRSGGAAIALDDTGCGFADADAVAALRPDIVKLCITVIRGAGRDPSILPELAASVTGFRALGAQVLAEGVETAEQAAALAPMGIELAQGWLYGKPVAAEQWSAS